MDLLSGRSTALISTFSQLIEGLLKWPGAWLIQTSKGQPPQAQASQGGEWGAACKIRKMNVC